MKLTVTLTRTRVESCDIEAADYEDARKKIAALYNDCFGLEEEYHKVEVSQNGLDITGRIQPRTPNLN